VGHETQRNIRPGDDDPIPVKDTVDQELHIDTFFMFGQVFFVSIDFLLSVDAWNGPRRVSLSVP
jgi:hypothetical protein